MNEEEGYKQLDKATYSIAKLVEAARPVTVKGKVGKGGGSGGKGKGGGGRGRR